VKVVLVEPFSAGVSLVEAFRERGIEPFRVYTPLLAAEFAHDPVWGGKILHDSVAATSAVLKEYGAEAVVAASETGVGLADELAVALGLPHNPLALGAARTSKLAESRALAAAGVPHARTAEVRGPDQVDDVLHGFDRFPVVVKPVASAGSDGIAICADADQVRQAVTSLHGTRNAVGAVNDSLLVQEYLDGPQYAVNTVTVDGHHVLSDVFVSRFDEVGGKPVSRHKISRRELSGTDEAVVDYGYRCLDAVGFVNGAGHTEIRLTYRGPVLVEANFRLMGPILPADVYVPALGHSHATLFADAVLGRPAFTDRVSSGHTVPNEHVGFVLLRAHAGGVVTGMPGLDEIRRLDTFHSFAKLPGLGTEIKNPLMTTGSGGLAYFVGPDANAILADMDRVHDLEDTGRLYEMSG
jgi:biotin carboxylase